MGWQAARALDRRYRVAASSRLPLLGLGAICGLLFFELASWPTRQPSRRDHCGGKRPPEGRVNRELRSETANPPRCRTSGQKRGVAPSTIPPSRAARRRAGRGGDRRGRRPTALYRRGLGESVPTRVRCGFPGIASTTAARAAPSDSAVLWLPNACTTWMRHPTLVRWPPIRRHGLDPRRRKSSIDPAPAEAAVFSSAWSIVSTTASRTP